MNCELGHNILEVEPGSFEQHALKVFNYQYRTNAIYRQFSELLKIDPAGVHSVLKIPFLPVSFFKSHEVVSGNFIPAEVFESSGTTQMAKSRHLVKDLHLYKESFLAAFRKFYGDPSEWCIIGLLPSYLERKHSSLVVMVHELIQMSGSPDSGFYLDDHARLCRVLQALEAGGKKTLLIGVTFALLDFAEQYSMNLSNIVVMETGGMKGRRVELTREQVHAFLKQRLGLHSVHSEYGMTELLSQAYAHASGIFRCPPWMKVLVREEDDPVSVKEAGEVNPAFPLSGVLNIIDLANVHSCAFIATEDIGRLYSDGGFEVLGRMDNSEMRGCSLLAV